MVPFVIRRPDQILRGNRCKSELLSPEVGIQSTYVKFHLGRRAAVHMQRIRVASYEENSVIPHLMHKMKN